MLTQKQITEAINYLFEEYDVTEPITPIIETISPDTSSIKIFDDEWLITTKYGKRQVGTIQREILSYPNNFALINI